MAAGWLFIAAPAIGVAIPAGKVFMRRCQPATNLGVVPQARFEITMAFPALSRCVAIVALGLVAVRAGKIQMKRREVKAGPIMIEINRVDPGLGNGVVFTQVLLVAPRAFFNWCVFMDAGFQDQTHLPFTGKAIGIGSPLESGMAGLAVVFQTAVGCAQMVRHEQGFINQAED